MNSKRMTAGWVAATALLTMSVAAEAQNLGRSSVPVYDYAKVVSSQPIFRYVTVKTPIRNCWQETEYYSTYRPRNVSGSTVAGAIIGGVIGHQFGSGHGRDAATIAGSLIGAAVGSGTAYARGSYGTARYSRPVERCATRYQDRQERRIDGYNVTYRYRGQTYATRMPYDPGKKIKVRIDIRPAG